MRNVFFLTIAEQCDMAFRWKYALVRDMRTRNLSLVMYLIATQHTGIRNLSEQLLWDAQLEYAFSKNGAACR